MTSLSELRFFTTPEHDCSYLQGKQALTLFADPLALIDTELYSSLSRAGFRRSGMHIYRPYCQTCSACIPIRIPVSKFNPHRRHKRVLKLNRDMVVDCIPPSVTQEYYSLYERYINARHADGDMYPPDITQFESFLVEGRPETKFFEFREHGKLVAVTVADKILDGHSAIYTFFDPDHTDQSPGVFAILWLIEETTRLSLEYLYLGYWIKQCRKMSYKVEYKPFELYINNHWISVTR